MHDFNAVIAVSCSRHHACSVLIPFFSSEYKGAASSANLGIQRDTNTKQPRKCKTDSFDLEQVRFLSADVLDSDNDFPSFEQENPKKSSFINPK